MSWFDPYDNLRQKRPLLASLDAALASLERGNHNSATGQLAASRQEVRAQVTDRVLAMELTDAAGEVIAALEAEGSPRMAGKIHSINRLSGKIQMQIKGDAGKAYILEGSTNLVDWEPVSVVWPDAEGKCCYDDVVKDKHQRGFYRLVEP